VTYGKMGRFGGLTRFQGFWAPRADDEFVL
jgi:hypothetical protein